MTDAANFGMGVEVDGTAEAVAWGIRRLCCLMVEDEVMGAPPIVVASKGTEVDLLACLLLVLGVAELS